MPKRETVQQGSQVSSSGTGTPARGGVLPPFRPATPVGNGLMQILKALELESDLVAESPVGKSAQRGLSLPLPAVSTGSAASKKPESANAPTDHRRLPRERYVEGFYRLVTQPTVLVSQYRDQPQVYRAIIEQLRPQWEQRVGFRLTDDEFEQVVRRALETRLLWYDLPSARVAVPGQWVYHEGYVFQIPGDKTAEDLPTIVWMKQGEWNDPEKRAVHLERARRLDQERRKARGSRSAQPVMSPTHTEQQR